MKYTEKILAEFDSRKHNWRLDFDFWEKNIKDFLAESIHQALAEDRERMRGEIEKAIENIEAPTDSEYELESLHEGYFKALDDLKPIISNILK